jgi:hypothetical protein
MAKRKPTKIPFGTTAGKAIARAHVFQTRPISVLMEAVYDAWRRNDPIAIRRAVDDLQEALHLGGHAEWQRVGLERPSNLRALQHAMALADFTADYINSCNWMPSEVTTTILSKLAVRAYQSDKEGSEDPPTRLVTKKPRDSKRTATLNARMIAVMLSKPESRGWRIREWASELKCSLGGIQKTETWKELQDNRNRLQAEKAMTKRRRSRPRKRE